MKTNFTILQCRKYFTIIYQQVVKFLSVFPLQYYIKPTFFIIYHYYFIKKLI